MGVVPAMSRVRRAGFSLLEVLVAMAVFAIVLVAVFGLIDQTRGAWKSARSSSESFQGARLAFEQLVRTLGGATLNTHYGYFDSAGRTPDQPGYDQPSRYGRQSELHFISGKSLVPGQVGHAIFFLAPLGIVSKANFQDMDSLLNACGYYVIHETDPTRPAFLDLPGYSQIPHPKRYRLMHFLQPSENLGVYDGTNATAWFRDPIAGSAPPVEQLAENVVALAILPRRSAFETDPSAANLTSDFEYDTRAQGNGGVQPATRHQLPPVVEVVLVAIDDSAAQRLGDNPLSMPAGLFLDPDRLESDLEELEKFLAAQNMRHRVFRATVAVKGAKWSA